MIIDATGIHRGLRRVVKSCDMFGVLGCASEDNVSATT